MSYYMASIVDMTLTAVVTIPALVLTGFLFHRTSGRSNDVNRRWIKCTKAAFVLYSLLGLLYLIISGVNISSIYDYYRRDSDSSFIAMQVLDCISLLFRHVGWATVFLALFYLARAISLSQFDETSNRYRIGRKCVLGAFIWVCLASLVVMCLYISISVTSYLGVSTGTYERLYIRSIVVWSLNLALYATHIICAIVTMVYTAKARKKVLNTPLQQASNLMLTCAVIWLVSNVWTLLFGIVRVYVPSFYDDGLQFWGGVVNTVLGFWMPFVVLVLLYVLATGNKYAMSHPQEQHQLPKNAAKEAS